MEKLKLSKRFVNFSTVFNRIVNTSIRLFVNISNMSNSVFNTFRLFH